jgi:restriction endonuclease Mrr
MELTYSNQLNDFDPEKRYRNPEHFDKPEAGVTRVLVIGDWPSVVDAYEAAGIDVSVKEAKRAQIISAGNQAELEKVIAALRSEHGSIQILVDGLETGEIRRPESGELALRLFDVLGTIHASAGELTTERDGLALTVDALREEIEALKKAPITPPADEAGEIAALKATLDEAKVQYRANASKESLEKLVAEVTKE